MRRRKKRDAVMTRKIMTICPAVQLPFVIRVLTTIVFEVGYQEHKTKVTFLPKKEDK
jgi:hypothetical protein